MSFLLITALLFGVTSTATPTLGPGLSTVVAAEQSDAELSRSTSAETRSLQNQTIKLKYRYDFGYQYRLFGSGAANAAATKNRLNGYQEIVKDILESQFGLTITLDTAARFYSRQDSCYAPNSDPTAVEMMNALTAAKIGDDTATHNACPDSHCTDTTCKNGTTYATTHHRSGSQALTYYISQKVSTAPAIWILFSGYDACRIRDGNHRYNVIAGVSRRSDQVGMVVHSDENDDISNGQLYRDTLTALHEISHCLGATGGNVDQAHYNNRCIMSSGSNRDNATLYNYWKNGNYAGLYCPDCKSLIKNYIQTH